MEPRPAPPSIHGASGHALLAAFAFVVTLFVTSALYSQYSARAIDAAAHSITQNAAPSIEHLAAARSELRTVEFLLTESLADMTPTRRDEIEAARFRVDTNLRAYLALPTFGNERDLWADVERELTTFDTVLRRALMALDAHDTAAARELVETDLRNATNRTDATAVRIIAYNAEHAHDQAVGIEKTRVRSLYITALLNGVSVLLAALTALLAYRSVRRYQRLLEASRRHAEERADEFEQFAARVAHDILSPLTTVGLALQLAERNAPEESRTRNALKGGRASLRRVQTIVDGLLEFARAGARPQPGARAAVREVVDDVATGMQSFALESGVELRVEPYEPCVVAASPGVLMSLLSNLLRNAVKYIGQGPDRRVVVRVVPDATFVRFEVEDTGPGLPPELGAKVFEPYVRGVHAKVPGIGLGLATVKRISQAHGGEVGVRPGARSGSVFWFELPRAEVLEHEIEGEGEGDGDDGARVGGRRPQLN